MTIFPYFYYFSPVFSSFFDSHRFLNFFGAGADKHAGEGIFDLFSGFRDIFYLASGGGAGYVPSVYGVPDPNSM